MATAHFLSCCAHSQSSTMMALKYNSPYAHISQSLLKTQGCILSLRPYRAYVAAKPRILRVMSMAAGQSDESRSLSLENIVNKARELWDNSSPQLENTVNKARELWDNSSPQLENTVNKARELWDNSPQPVKIFPWNSVLENFVRIILDLVLAVFKWLYVPILVVTSVSELSYCALEKKSYLIPLPFLVGASIAGILNSVALESSPSLKNFEVPWHLIAIVILFTLLKLPGPYYPYWGRILIPHIANGALYRTIWFLFLWYRRPRKPSEEVMPESVLVPSEQNVP